MVSRWNDDDICYSRKDLCCAAWSESVVLWAMWPRKLNVVIKRQQYVLMIYLPFLYWHLKGPKVTSRNFNKVFVLVMYNKWKYLNWRLDELLTLVKLFKRPASYEFWIQNQLDTFYIKNHVVAGPPLARLTLKKKKKKVRPPSSLFQLPFYNYVKASLSRIHPMGVVLKDTVCVSVTIQLVSSTWIITEISENANLLSF